MFCPFDGARLEDTIWVAPTDPSVDALLGTTVDGRYVVKRVLGEGGTGTVYEVVHQSLSRPFAMKVLRRDVADDDSLATRFIQEARATAALKHPHIVSITDFGRLPDRTPYFVMERLVGHTLAHVCKVGGQVALDRAVDIVLQVAGALAVAHEAGVIHRDLKPENLFLVGHTDDGPAVRDDVRVVDFGAAKIAGATRITKTGIVFGTPHYMSPEQASGQPVDHRADIYALGVIMYELFAGHLPFEGDTLMGVLTKHMFVPPPPFADAVRSPADDAARRLMGALETVTLRALEKKPEQRFQTMAALAAELEQTVSFPESGGVCLASDWRSPPSSRSRRDAGGTARGLPGHGGVATRGSDDLPLIPGTSWRGPALVGGGVFLFAAVAGSLLIARRNLAQHPPLAGSSVPSLSASAPPPPVVQALPPTPMPRSLHLTTTPPFAEVWREGRRIGTTPMDLAADPSGAAMRCTIRAAGYAGRDVVIDASSGPSVDITLEKVATAPVAPRNHKPPVSPRRPASSDGELVDPFSR
jgi:serine/threonine-protein kinase